MKNWLSPHYESALQRIDMLVYREILRLRATYQLSMDEFRGLFISDEQVDELILQHHDFGQVDTASLSRKAAELADQARAQLLQDPAWSRLVQAFALSDAEQDLLLLAFLPEIHGKYAILYAYLNNDITRKYPTIELALNLLVEADHREIRQGFGQQSPLLRHALIKTVTGANDYYSLQSGFVIAPVLREFLLGHRALDAVSARVCRLTPPNNDGLEGMPFAASLIARFDEFAEVIQHTGRMPFFVVESESDQGAEVLARGALSAAGLGCCRLALQPLLREREEFNNAVTGLVHSATLEHAGLVVTDFGVALEQEPSQRALLGLLLSRLDHARLPTFLLVQPNTRWWELLNGYHQLSCVIDAAEVTQREAFWRHHLAAQQLEFSESDVVAVADYFNLGYTQVQSAVDDLGLRRRIDQATEGVAREHLFAAARGQSHADIGELADRVRKEFQIEDLVLPKAIMARINELISAIHARRLVFEQWGLKRRMGGSSGIVALFAGASGTGKTMTASVIANAIDLDLYRIELSGVVSKYIGETEKNLDRIFAAAYKANCILFFDEADALFGKRSEVKDAHDRYANIEVAYLLQKIENHNGIVILTTNLAKSIDQAFTRRMQFIIEFPRPDVAQREQLWRGMFGAAVPLADDVDFNFLARQLENTGGDIKNMVLDAALMAAASEHQQIDMALLVRAAARQMMKQGKVPSAIEFKHYFSLVDERSAQG